MLASLRPLSRRPAIVPSTCRRGKLTVCGCFKQRRRGFNNSGDGISNVITAGGLGHERVELFSCFHISLEQTLRPRCIAREQVQLLPGILSILRDDATAAGGWRIHRSECGGGLLAESGPGINRGRRGGVCRS